MGSNCPEGVFVSGSMDKSLIIWSKYELPGSSSTSTYSHRVLTGHKSGIIVIIRISNREIICGELTGDSMFWDIVEGVCNRQITFKGNDSMNQMKQHLGNVAVSYMTQVYIWGAANNWEFGGCDGRSIEFLTSDILLRGVRGEIGIYRLWGNRLFTTSTYTKATFMFY